MQGIAVNPKTNRVYAVYMRGPHFHAIAELNAATGKVTARVGGDYSYPLYEAYAIAVDVERNRIYADDQRGLVALGGASRTLTRVSDAAEIGYAFGMVFDTMTRQLIPGGLESDNMLSVSTR